MASAKWGKFVGEVLKEVKFKYDHEGIRQELLEHMEELYEDLRAEGMDGFVAEIMAVEYMGDAKEIGQALHEEHSPILGWLWRISKWMVWIVFLFSMVWWAGPFLRSAVINGFDKYEERKNVEIVYDIEVDQTVETYGEKIHFDEVLYYEDGILEIRSSTRNWGRIENESALTSGNRIVIADETGNRYDVRIAPEEDVLFLLERKGVYFKSQLYVPDFPADAEKLYIGYDWQMKEYIEVDLRKGGGA